VGLERIGDTKAFGGNMKAMLGFAFSCAMAVSTAAAESNPKAKTADQTVRVCLLGGEQVSGPNKLCFYGDCLLGITVKSDESCPLYLNPPAPRSKTDH
jgi:hypothetical protein